MEDDQGDDLDDITVFIERTCSLLLGAQTPEEVTHAALQRMEALKRLSQIRAYVDQLQKRLLQAGKRSGRKKCKSTQQEPSRETVK